VRRALEQTHGVRYVPCKFRLDRLILSHSVGEKPRFLPFFGLRHLVLSPNWQQSDKAEHGCITTNLPLSNGIKIVSVLQRLRGEIWRTISDVQKRDEQINRQTKKLNVFGCPGGGEIRAPPNWHSDRGPRVRPCTSKTFSGLTHSFAARGR